MLVRGMNHFTILSSDVERTTRFYCDLLDLESGYRPSLRSPGAWLYVDGSAVLHIIGRDQVPDPPAGVIDHLAFTASDIGLALDRLDERGIPCEVRKQVGSGIWQVFFHDPDGAKVELDFDPAETLPQRHASRA